ncbi:hypothetical protein NUU61_008454 [Penicillium alfredii]|uniref:Hemerythrin-like domain-containing protein n=1 Tax=Penicillium alfredii TaxID=1506179 RepID=A0A9W9ELG7_9EURO|nr:uncharacterized protein NUU61_008454 [Penicillium alfredii]KAJ5083875.1 hypothetical protein NUU61_008454 [Penicillium alfredii]
MVRIIDAVRKDHKELESYYNKIVTSEDADEQTRFQNQFTWELARHSVGEELVVYPAMKKYLRDGEKDREQHRTVFQDLPCSDPRFIPTITILMDDFAQHMHDVETIDLVKLESAITPKESERLGKSFDRTKIFMPTRSHPSLPDRPPYETATGLMAAPLDHLQDIFRRWPDDGVNLTPSME